MKKYIKMLRKSDDRIRDLRISSLILEAICSGGLNHPAGEIEHPEFSSQNILHQGFRCET